MEIEEQEYWNKPPHPIVEPIVRVFHACQFFPSDAGEI